MGLIKSYWFSDKDYEFNNLRNILLFYKICGKIVKVTLNPCYAFLAPSRNPQPAGQCPICYNLSIIHNKHPVLWNMIYFWFHWFYKHIALKLFPLDNLWMQKLSHENMLVYWRNKIWSIISYYKKWRKKYPIKMQ